MTEKVPEEVWVFPKIGSKKQRVIYDQESMQHPAKMDTYLTRRLLKEFTKAGDVVLDPMAGVGTTGVEAVLLGRHCILVDIEENFTSLIQKNLNNVKAVFEKGSFKPKLGKAVVITGDSRHLSELLQQHADAIITSPPYAHEATASKPTKLEEQGFFKMGHSKESPYTEEDYRTWDKHEGGNIGKRKLFVRVPCTPEEAQFHDTREGRKGTIWEWTKEVKVDMNNLDIQKQKHEEKGKAETYLEAMLKCYREMYTVLKPNGLCIIVLKNFIRNWEVVDLISVTVKLCEFVGFKLVKKIKFKLPTKSFWRILYQRQWKKKFNKPFPTEKFASVYDYETVLVFQKM